MTEYLLRKAKHGDSDAFCRLMDLQMQSMYKIARSYLKTMRMLQMLSRIRFFPAMKICRRWKQNRYFKTWLTRILINKCRDILRRQSRVFYTDSIPEKPVYEEDFEALEWNQILAPLDEKYRTILLLYYMEGFNAREISDILSIKESTVKSRLPARAQTNRPGLPVQNKGGTFMMFTLNDNERNFQEQLKKTSKFRLLYMTKPTQLTG